MIDVADLELTPAEAAMPDLDLRAARLRAEREVLRAALARSNNTLATAARLLGVSRPTLYGLHGSAWDRDRGDEISRRVCGYRGGPGRRRKNRVKPRIRAMQLFVTGGLSFLTRRQRKSRRGAI